MNKKAQAQAQPRKPQYPSACKHLHDINSLLSKPAFTPRFSAKALAQNAEECGQNLFAPCAFCGVEVTEWDVQNACSALEKFGSAKKLSESLSGAKFEADMLVFSGMGRSRPKHNVPASLTKIDAAELRRIEQKSDEWWFVESKVIYDNVEEYLSTNPKSVSADGFVVWFSQKRYKFLECVVLAIRVYERIHELVQLWDTAMVDDNLDTAAFPSCMEGVRRISRKCHDLETLLGSVVRKLLPVSAAGELVTLFRDHGAHFPTEPYALVYAARERAFLAELIFCVSREHRADSAVPCLVSVRALLQVHCDGLVPHTRTGVTPSLSLIPARYRAQYDRKMRSAEMYLCLATVAYVRARGVSFIADDVRSFFPTWNRGNSADKPCGRSSCDSGTSPLARPETVPRTLAPFLLAWAVNVSRSTENRDTLPFCATAVAFHRPHSMLLRTAEASYVPLKNAWPSEQRREVVSLAVAEVSGAMNAAALPDYGDLVLLVARATAGECGCELAKRLVAAADGRDDSPVAQFLSCVLERFPAVPSGLSLCASLCTSANGCRLCCRRLAQLKTLTLAIPVKTLDAYDKAGKIKFSEGMCTCCSEDGVALPGAYRPTLDGRPSPLYIRNGTKGIQCGECVCEEDSSERNGGENSGSKSILIRWDLSSENYSALTYVLGYVRWVCDQARCCAAWNMTASQCSRLNSILSFFGALFSQSTLPDDVIALLQTVLSCRTGTVLSLQGSLRWIIERALSVLVYGWSLCEIGTEGCLELVQSAAELVCSIFDVESSLRAYFGNHLARVLVAGGVPQHVAKLLSKDNCHVTAAKGTLALLTRAAAQLVSRCVVAGGARESACESSGRMDDSSCDKETEYASAVTCEFAETFLVRLVSEVRDSFFMPVCPSDSVAPDAVGTWSFFADCLSLFSCALTYVQHTAASRETVRAISELLCCSAPFATRLALIIVHGVRAGPVLSEALELCSCVESTLSLISGALQLTQSQVTPLVASLLAPAQASASSEQASVSASNFQDSLSENTVASKELLLTPIVLSHVVHLTQTSGSLNICIYAWNVLTWCCCCCSSQSGRTAQPSLAGCFGSGVDALRKALAKQLAPSSKAGDVRATIAAIGFLHAAAVHQPALTHMLLLVSPQESSEGNAGTTLAHVIGALMAAQNGKGDLAVVDRIMSLVLAMREKNETFRSACIILAHEGVWEAVSKLIITGGASKTPLACACQAKALLLLASEVAQANTCSPKGGFKNAVQQLFREDSRFPDCCIDAVLQQLDMKKSHDSENDSMNDGDKNSGQDDSGKKKDGDDDQTESFPNQFCSSALESYRTYAKLCGFDANGVLECSDRPPWASTYSRETYLVDCGFLVDVLIGINTNDDEIGTVCSYVYSLNASVLTASSLHTLVDALAVFLACLARNPEKFKCENLRRWQEKRCGQRNLSDLLVHVSSRYGNDVLSNILSNSLAVAFCQLIHAQNLGSEGRNAVNIDMTADAAACALCENLSHPIPGVGGASVEDNLQTRFYRLATSGVDNSCEEKWDELCCLTSAILTIMRGGKKGMFEQAKARLVLPLVSLVTAAEFLPVGGTVQLPEPAILRRNARLYSLATALLTTVFQASCDETRISAVAVYSANIAASVARILAGVSSALGADAPSEIQNPAVRRVVDGVAVSALNLLTSCVRATTDADSELALQAIRPFTVATSHCWESSPVIWEHVLALLTVCVNRFSSDVRVLAAAINFSSAHKNTLIGGLDISKITEKSSQVAAKTAAKGSEKPGGIVLNAVFIGKVWWSAAFAQALCRRHDAWALDNIELSSSLLRALAKFLWQAVALGDSFWANLGKVQRDKIMQAFTAVAVAVRTALPAFSRTRAIEFRENFCMCQASCPYDGVFRPLRSASEPSLCTLIDCVKLADAHACDEVRETAVSECLAALLALLSMFWDDVRIPSIERRNMRDQTLDQLKDVLSTISKRGESYAALAETVKLGIRETFARMKARSPTSQ